MGSSVCNSIFILATIIQLGLQNAISDSQKPAILILHGNYTSIPNKAGSSSVSSETKQFSGGQECNPPATAELSQFIIGYGSLMQTASKNRTSPNTGENIPVKVYGYSRHWNCKGTSVSFSTTYLGVQSNPQKSFNAAIYKLPNATALKGYDTRESFYCREEVPMSKIQVSTNRKTLDLGQYWIYVTKPEHSEDPSREYPIVQSYVDTFLSGCIELETKFGVANFANDCITSTLGWDAPWVNDRIYPRRPFMHQPLAGKIDKLLNTMIPKAFSNIRIE